MQANSALLFPIFFGVAPYRLQEYALSMKSGENRKERGSRKREGDARPSYGRQAAGKTIKSVSLSKDLVEYGEAEAKRLRLPFSRWLELLLARHFKEDGKE